MSDNSPPTPPPAYGGSYGAPAQPPPVYGGDYNTPAPPPVYGGDYGAATPAPVPGSGYPAPTGPAYGPPPPGTYQVPAAPTPAGQAARRVRRGGLGLLLRLGVVALFVFGGSILYATGILSHVSAPDYPGAQKSSLSADGKSMADNLYEDHNADTSHVKAFYTTDNVPAVAAFYKSKLTADGWTVSDEQNDADSAITVFDKDSQETVLITGPGSLHWVQNAPDNSTSIILLIGDKSSQ